MSSSLRTSLARSSSRHDKCPASFSWLQRIFHPTGAPWLGCGRHSATVVNALYGMLPLIHEMHVALTDHIDRPWQEAFSVVALASSIRGCCSRPRQIPRRRVDTAKLSQSQASIPSRRGEALGGWPKAVLKITRRQKPLAPAFEMTARAGQGQTHRAAIVDLQIGRGTNATASFVAWLRAEPRRSAHLQAT